MVTCIINSQLVDRRVEMGLLRADTRVHSVWHEGLEPWHDLFDWIVEDISQGREIERLDLKLAIEDARDESMKVFGISRKFKDPESRWFFAVCKEILEPYAWRLARLKKNGRQTASSGPRRSSRTSKIIELPLARAAP